MSSAGPKKPSNAIAQELKEICGEDVVRCYQCGKCTAGCPMAVEADLTPNQIARLVQLGEGERALDCEAIWLCLGCETCTARCPQKVDLAGIMDGMREISLRRNKSKAAKNIRAFHQAFLDQVKTFGRVPEFPLIGDYKLRSGAFFQDILVAPSMAQKGKIKFVPEKVKGAAEVKKIFQKVMAKSQGSEKA